jgi:hypothetical protein
MDWAYGPGPVPPPPRRLPLLLVRRMERLANGSSCSADAKGGLGKGRSISSPARNVARDGRRLRESAQ